MGKNRAWRAVKEEYDTGDGYVVHAADERCKHNVSRARSRAICALAARGILLIDETPWPRAHPVVYPRINRGGGWVAVNVEVDGGGSVENDVLDCHAVLGRLAHGNALIKGGHMHCVDVRFPGGVEQAWTPPSLGWHMGRGAGCGLHSICILHLTSVPTGGGGVAVVVGSHKFVCRVLSCRWIPACVRGAYLFRLLLGYLVSWAAWCGEWEIREVVASEGEVVQMDPYLVHSPSRNANGHETGLSCQVKIFSRVPSRNYI